MKKNILLGFILIIALMLDIQAYSQDDGNSQRKSGRTTTRTTTGTNSNSDAVRQSDRKSTSVNDNKAAKRNEDRSNIRSATRNSTGTSTSTSVRSSSDAVRPSDRNTSRGNDNRTGVSSYNRYGASQQQSVTSRNHQSDRYSGNHNYNSRNVVVVNKHKENHYKSLPVGYSSIYHRNNHFYYHDGYFYRHYNGTYIVSVPPRGVRVAHLPVYHRVVYMNGSPFYYSRGVYYRQVETNMYETIEPTIGTIVPELPEVNVDEVVIDGLVYYRFDNLLYKPVVTKVGVQYEVVGTLND